MTQQSIHYNITKTNEAIQAAADHANAVHPGWSEQAYGFLKEYIKTNRSFMTEDVRYASQGIVPIPPHLRAWGSVIKKAAKECLIKHARYEQVKTASSHRAMASVWHTI